MSRLRRVLGGGQIFTLGFGSIVGVGWVVGLGSFVRDGGPIGAALAFAIGGAITMLVGLCYAEMIGLVPACGGEIAYAYDVLGPAACFVTGWMLLLANAATLVFEALGMTWIVATLVPSVHGPTLYTVAGYPLGVGDLLLGAGGMAIIATLNVIGLGLAARMQYLLTVSKTLLTLLVIGVGLFAISQTNLEPLFGPGPTKLGGVTAVLIGVPFWLSGYNLIAQVAEEAGQHIAPPQMGRMLLLSIVSATVVYMLLIVACAGLLPRAQFLALDLPASQVFAQRFAANTAARVVLIVALFGNITVWNSMLIATSRVVFSLARAGMMPAGLARVHSRYGTPAVAVITVAVVSSLGILLGKQAIMPVVNVASTCFALAGALVCALVLRLRHVAPDRARPFRITAGVPVAWIGLLSSLGLVGVSLSSPTRSFGNVPLEWVILAAWIGAGVLIWQRLRRAMTSLSEAERRAIVLGAGAEPVTLVSPTLPGSR